MVELSGSLQPIKSVLQDSRTVRRVGEYFGTFGTTRFTGRLFERLGGGGDRQDAASRFDGDDIAALALLSVTVPGEAIIELLHERSEYLSELLAEIPIASDIRTVDEKWLLEGPPAELWRRLMTVRGLGHVSVSKLMSRKRPALVPILDVRISRVVSPPKGHWWSVARAALLDEGISLDLQRLRKGAMIPAEVSELRLLDVALWRAGQ